VASGQGALFPVLGAGDYFYCTLGNLAGAVEIVKVTARSTDTMTVVRGLDGTTAAAWNAGDKVELRLVAATLNDFPKLDEDNTFSGNLGLGGTPNAWNASWKALQVSTNAVLASVGSVADLQYNAYRNTLNVDTYISSDFATRYRQISGTHTWATAPAGTAGAAVTFTQSMTLDASGNLGIGTTSPYAQVSIKGAGTFGVYQTTAGNAPANIYLGDGNFYTSGAYNLAPGIGSLYDAGQGVTAGLGLYYYNGSARTLGATLDVRGNLGLGVTPSAWYSSYGTKAFQFAASGVLAGLDVSSSDRRVYLMNNAFINSSGNQTYINAGAATQYQQNAGQHQWFNAASGTAGNTITFTQAMTLDASGNLLVGTTTSSTGNNNGLILGAAAMNVQHVSGTASGTSYVNFWYNGSLIGSITQSGTAAVLYNITSDQRLKQNIVDAAPASDLIDAIKVRQYDWKSDGSHQRYGFIAQELLAVAPEAVHQPADPEEMMAVDYSKLVPMLVKEIQSLRKRLADAGI
jgi:hypothetical protein